MIRAISMPLINKSDEYGNYSAPGFEMFVSLMENWLNSIEGRVISVNSIGGIPVAIVETD